MNFQKYSNTKNEHWNVFYFNNFIFCRVMSSVKSKVAMATRMTIDFIMGKKFLQGKIWNVKNFISKVFFFPDIFKERTVRWTHDVTDVNYAHLNRGCFISWFRVLAGQENTLESGNCFVGWKWYSFGQASSFSCCA